MTTTICLRSARSIPTIAFVTGTSSRSRASRALRFRSPRETPLPLVMNVLLLRWDTKPDKRIRRTFNITVYGAGDDRGPHVPGVAMPQPRGLDMAGSSTPPAWLP